MAFTDYEALCDSIGNWLARDDLIEETKDWIWLTECDVQRTGKFRMRDEIAIGTTVNEQEWIDLPGDYSEGGLLRWTSDDNLPTVEVGSYDTVDKIQKDPNRRNAGTQMRVGFLHGSRLYIGPRPGELDYELFYKAGVQHLGSKVKTNLLLQQYPDCLLYWSLVQSAPFLGADERVQIWAGFYDNAKEETRMQEWRARSGHGALRMRPDVKVA